MSTRNKPKTTFAAGCPAPWPPPRGKSGRRLSIAPKHDVDLDQVRIVKAVIPEKRQIYSKYDDLFMGLKPGKALRCKAEEAESIARALRYWLKKMGRTEKVCTSSRIREPDGAGFRYVGQVWLSDSSA